MCKLFPTIVVTLETWYWLCPRTWNSPLKMLLFKEVHSCPNKKIWFMGPNSIFENVFEIILSDQIWVLVGFWMSGNHWGHILNILWVLEAIWEKIIFFIFLKIFASLLSNFGFKMKQNWVQNFWKCRFFKNEALNQKSGTVKVLGYASTISDDCGDLKKVILAIPPCFETPHENAVFHNGS